MVRAIYEASSQLEFLIRKLTLQDMNSVPPLIPGNAPKKSGMPTWVLALIIAGGIGLVLIATIGLLAAIAIPNFVRARDNAQRNICISNLRFIDAAKQQWALENKKEPVDVPTEADVKAYLKDGQFLVCPKGGKYTIGAVNTDPICTFPDHRLPTP